MDLPWWQFMGWQTSSLVTVLKGKLIGNRSTPPHPDLRLPSGEPLLRLPADGFQAQAFPRSHLGRRGVRQASKTKLRG